jgi:hypothetical protein
MGRQGRQKVPPEQAAEIRRRLKYYLTEHYGSPDRFRLLASGHGWLKSNTFGRWLDVEGEPSVPDPASLLVLAQRTGINLTWLLTGVGPKHDPITQLGLDAQVVETPAGFDEKLSPAEEERALSELREKIRDKVSQRSRQQQEVVAGAPVGTHGPDVLGAEQSKSEQARLSPPVVLHPSLAGTYRAITCRYCGAEFRQQLEDPANQDSWAPRCCTNCLEDRVEIPLRREELERRKRVPPGELPASLAITERAVARRRDELAQFWADVRIAFEEAGAVALAHLGSVLDEDKWAGGSREGYVTVRIIGSPGGALAVATPLLILLGRALGRTVREGMHVRAPWVGAAEHDPEGCACCA